MPQIYYSYTTATLQLDYNYLAAILHLYHSYTTAILQSHYSYNTAIAQLKQSFNHKITNKSNTRQRIQAVRALACYRAMKQNMKNAARAQNVQ